MEETGNSEVEEIPEESKSLELEESPDINDGYFNSRDIKYETNKGKELPIAKKSGKIKGLEKAVSELKAKATKADVDSECQNADSAQNLAELVQLMYSTSSDEEKDTPNGAVAIIYHKDKKTGNIEFLFEEKPPSYPIAEARGKLSFVGGAIQRGESSLEALVRELKEEIEEPAATIVLKSLRKDDNPYLRLPYEYKGKTGYTDIYVIHVEQENDWNAVKWASFKGDAGFPRIRTHNEIIGYEKDFGFDYGRIATKFVKDNLGFDGHTIKPLVYADSVSKTSAHLTLLSSSNYSFAGL